MDRVSFRYLLDDMLIGKSEKVKEKVQQRVGKVLSMITKGYISEENVAMIIVQVENEVLQEQVKDNT